MRILPGAIMRMPDRENFSPREMRAAAPALAARSQKIT
jgi:hypothetical protein